MANSKSNSKSPSLLSSLTGHIASWVTGNTGMSGQAAKTLQNRQNSIDSQVESAVNPPTQQPQKQTNASGKWPWQNK